MYKNKLESDVKLYKHESKLILDKFNIDKLILLDESSLFLTR